MKNIISLLITFTLFTSINSQQSFYVDGTNGNDNNNGSLAHPWKTIQKSFDNAIAGSTVFIRGGTYNTQQVLNVSGTSGNPIEFRNYQNEVVIIDGTGLDSTVPMIEMRNDSNIIIRNLTIRNLVGDHSKGILVVCDANGQSKNLTFKNLTIKNISWNSNKNAIPNPQNPQNAHPIIVYGFGSTLSNVLSNITIDSCQVYNNVTGYSEAISLDGNIDGIIVSNNIVHDNTNIGIDLIGNYATSSNPSLDQARNAQVINNICYNNISNVATSAGIYVDGGKNITIERNTTYSNGHGIEIGCENDGTASDIIVRENIIYHNQVAGLAVGGYNKNTTGKVVNCYVYNNTFFQNDYNREGYGELNITKVNNCVYKNNIFYTNDENILLAKQNITPQTGIVFAYNCWFTPNKDSNHVDMYLAPNTISTFSNYRSTFSDYTSIYADPNFIDTSLAVANFQINPQSNSLIDKGDPNYVPANGETDILGRPRVSGGRIDIGPYEFQTPMPLHLINFYAQKEFQNVLITWITVNEINNMTQFTIERSIDGINFTPITTMYSQNNYYEESYSFTDKKPYNGINYYRLKQTDLNGSVSYSNTISINMVLNQNIITVEQNKQIKIIHFGTSTIAKIYNAAGNLIKSAQLKEGQNIISIPQAPSGVYFLLINGKTNKIKL